MLLWSNWKGIRLLTGTIEVQVLAGAPSPRSTIGRAPDYGSGGCRFEPGRGVQPKGLGILDTPSTSGTGNP